MSRPYIPPFPTGNTSSDTQYTQYFEKARTQRGPVNPPGPVSGGNPITPPVNPRHRESDPVRATASPLHQVHLPGGRSPLHQQGNNNGSGSYGSNGSGNSHHRPVNPSKNSASGRSQEGLIGYGTPARNTPSRSKKKPVEQDPYDDLLPPFPTDGTNANYTEVFKRYKANMSPAPPPIGAYTPKREESPEPKPQRCSCFGL